ncbi:MULTISPECIES: dihydrolipoyl dehydrogenase [Psychrilyobacter]|uniref:Dihydrolipoyl dehydrogenase n=1 Tax=Psychrilyobacter piezotolerans TaxID=2293438 RepID=A0ABX9KIE6_9FUSO|nr:MULTISPECIES: dihydrolipoyl dehydrogenase [Psychrilyobacter]NDI77483.1 dihydrolipoyl dehydrogenase [Psychrilyobacter piezotolerans]RDE63009.1 dihydrolipoyl dehydrogenase [Psychrilyobacter sp. S5]REI41767.1 dihydrolipoyl dehydrogenase [Psychrilyobacter piezotolerans]
MEIKLEQLSGESKSGSVGKINVKIGDEIKTGDILLQVESQKGNVSVKSNASGIVEKIAIDEGNTVNIGDVLFEIDGVQNEESTEKTGGFNYFGNLMKPQKQEIEADITIIGAGPGGYVAAIHAAKQGKKVVIIEKEHVGGTCLNHGCIPTKALVRSSEIYRNMKEADSFGIFAENVSVDMGKVIDRKDKIKNQLKNGIEYLLENHNIEKLHGKGKIIDANTVFVKTNRTEITINTKDIIIATGSESSTVPIKGIESKNVLTSKEALNMTSLPQKLVIVGGGVIGMEFAFIYESFGVEVFVVEYADGILASLDEDVCDEISKIAVENGIKLYTGSKVGAIDETENGGAVVSFIKEGETRYISCDKVLVAVGRQPYFKGLGLEELGIEMNDGKKGIKINEKMQTNIQNIYAIGDVTNVLQLAHVASHQGMVAVDNILGENKIIDYSTVPSAIFTEPEIAVVGITEKIANEKGIEIVVGKFPMSANGKALTLGDPKGFVKIIKEKSTGKIIGSTIIGPHATDLLSSVTLCINNGLTTEQITETIFAHPTTAESIHEAALSVEGGAIHFA